MAMRRHIALLACVAHRAEQVCQFRRSGVTYSGDNRDFRLLLWGNGANTGQLAYLRRHIAPEAIGTETPHCTFGMRGPSGRTRSVCQVSSLWVTYSER
ncbi:hypothetical protein DPMN_092440 [Dreissena polymorpha]|uniref:Uncharacterized protein n=1 Tax=Dreissena polymorpha TaxID=45954 RepID=A0A9D4R1P0_DREPO|nr:hypothetical protein DPMN_092440 [Dreissena polymorpha]